MFPTDEVEGQVPESARVLGVERVGGDAKSPWGSCEGGVDDRRLVAVREVAAADAFEDRRCSD
jgi:hypothetical protein